MANLKNLPPCGLPVDNPTEPFWLCERSRLDQHRTSETLPSTADVVVVGSGLSGAMLTYHLLCAQPSLNIVMLEARGTCTGASARNGGQVKTDPYVIYNHLKARYGAQVANDLLKFETDHLALFEEFLRREPDIECAFHVTTAFDVCMTEPMAKTARDSFRARQRDFPDDMSEYRELDRVEEIERVTGVQEAKWAAMYRVASIWPYKLATGVLERCFAMARAGGGAFALHTTTPVLALSTSPDSLNVVETPRGSIRARQVAVCTNGYASNLLPELVNRVIPVKGTASSLLPPERQPVGTPSSKIFRPLSTSYAFKFGAGGRGEYMISRQEGRREVILGGAKHVYIDDAKTWYGVHDDSEQFPGAREHFDRYMPTHFVNWPDATSNLDRVWTGILGYSSDSFPWVGQLPTRPQGVFTLAGFHGHGMCRILGSTQALARLMLSGEGGTAGLQVLRRANLPEAYLITDVRLQSKDNEVLEGIEQTQAAKAHL